MILQYKELKKIDREAGGVEKGRIGSVAEGEKKDRKKMKYIEKLP